MRFATFSSFMILISQIYLPAATAMGSSPKVKTESKCTQLHTAAHAPDTWDYFIQLKMSEIAQTDEGVIDFEDAPTELRRDMLLIFQRCEGKQDLNEDAIKVRCQNDNCIVSTAIPSRCPPEELSKELSLEILDIDGGHILDCDTPDTCTQAVLQPKVGSPSKSPVSNTAPFSYRIEHWGGGTIWQIRLHSLHNANKPLQSLDYANEAVAFSVCNGIWDELERTTRCIPYPRPYPRECEWNYQPETAYPGFVGDALVLRVVMPDKCDREAQQQEVKQSIERVIASHGYKIDLYCTNLKTQMTIQDTNDMWLKPYGEDIEAHDRYFRENGIN